VSLLFGLAAFLGIAALVVWLTETDRAFHRLWGSLYWAGATVLGLGSGEQVTRPVGFVVSWVLGERVGRTSSSVRALTTDEDVRPTHRPKFATPAGPALAGVFYSVGRFCQNRRGVRQHAPEIRRCHSQRV
jgi:hypothetical protein